MTDFLSTDILLLLIVTGLVAGFLAGLLGIGGGVVTVPAQMIIYGYLDFPSDWKMHMAVGTSLVIIVITNMSSVLAHHRRGSVDWSLAKDWCLVIAIGALLGSMVAKELKTFELVMIFAALGLLLALKMLLPLDHLRFADQLPAGRIRFIPPAVIGFLSAILGIGGGSFSVPYMTLYGTVITKAVGTASLIGIVIAVSGGAGFIINGLFVDGLPDYTLGFIHIPTLVVIALAAMVIAPLGAKIAHMLAKRTLSLIFGLFIVLAVSRMIMSV